MGNSAGARLRAALLAVLMAAGGAAAADGKAPEAIPGSVRVTAEGLIELAGGTPGLVLIDARLPSDRRHGYLEGSVSLPDERTDCAALNALAAGRETPLETPLLFYCNGPNCLRSAASVRIAVDCGFHRVYWFRGGLEEWRAKHYPFLTEGS